jgi:hypothetical protein
MLEWCSGSVVGGGRDGVEKDTIFGEEKHFANW